MAQKTKKVLLLVSKAPSKSREKESLNWTSLREWVQREVGESVVIEIAAFPDFVYRTGEQTSITHAVHGYDVADFDLVIVRTVGESLELAIAVAHYLEAKQVPFTDRYILTQGKGKLSCSFPRALAGVPVPETVYATAKYLGAYLKREKPFSYPFVLKADGGKKGNDNYLVRSSKQLAEVLSQTKNVPMIAQQFIPNDGDYRLLVLNGEPLLLIFRTAAKGSHLNNTSKGGGAQLRPLSDLSKKIIKDSLHATSLERLQFAGVDVVIDKNTGKHYFLEVNRAPQIPTGAFAEEKVAAYAAAIKKAVKKNDPIRDSLPVIGRAERVGLSSFGVENIPAKIDTGADLSSIWATDIHETDGRLSFKLFGPENEHYTGEKVTVASSDYDVTRVANSFGHRELRYKIKIPIQVGGRRIKATFTLADRSNKLYAILIGRKLLAGKFLVDVSAGEPLREEEKQRKRSLREYLNKLRKPL